MVQNTSSISHMDSTVSIIEFLQRPIKLEHFQLRPGGVTPLYQTTVTTGAKGAQVPVKTYNLPNDILALGGKLQKVANFQYFKADIHIKIVLNTNPFVAGRFWLTYSPYENVISDSRKQIRASRSGVTAYPGVEIDVQLDNSVEMMIPYASYKEAYVLTTEPENFVTLYLYAITDVLGQQSNGGDAGVVDIAVYAWFENIQLNIPTLKPVFGVIEQQQVGSLSEIDKERLVMARKMEKLSKDNPSIYQTLMQYLNPTRKIRSIGYDTVDAEMQVQAETFSSGPIGSIASTVGGVADAISNAIPIPIVSEIASGVGWVADIVGSIANIFGWSRPNSDREICPLQNVPGKAFTHTDCIDQSVPLALTVKNELDKAYNIFPSGVDEMDLAYVCANPAVKGVYTWEVKTAEEFINTPLALIPVGIGPFSAFSTVGGTTACQTTPALFRARENMAAGGAYKEFCIANNLWKCTGSGENAELLDANVQAVGTIQQFVLDTAPCEYVSQLFTNWRATMCFKISVVKTAFHTGRLEIFFDPGMYEVAAATPYVDPNLSYYTNLDTTNNYKYILDLTNDTEITIRVPFVSERLFLNTHGLNSGATMPTVQDVANSIIGSLVIRPVSNLLAPSTVTQKVEIVVWKWAEDVVLTVPVNGANSNMRIYTGASMAASCPDPAPNILDLGYDTIGGLPGLVDSNTYKSYPTSVRQTRSLIDTVDAEMQINIGNKADGNVITFFNSVNIAEENFKACKNASGERIVSLRPLLRVFREWSEREADVFLDFQENSAEQLDASGNALNLTDFVSYLSYMYRFFRGGLRYKFFSDNSSTRTKITTYIHPGKVANTRMAPSHVTYSDLNPVHEVSVPYYSQYRKLPISVGDNILNITTHSTKSKDKLTVYRSGNDDLTYGWMMGTPQLLPGPGTIIWTGLRKTSDGTQSSVPNPNTPGYDAEAVAKALQPCMTQEQIKNDLGDPRAAFAARRADKAARRNLANPYASYS